MGITDKVTYAEVLCFEMIYVETPGKTGESAYGVSDLVAFCNYISDDSGGATENYRRSLARAWATLLQFPRLRLHPLQRVITYQMDPKSANLPFPSPASRRAPFIATPPATTSPATTLPATPARLFSPEYVASTPDSNHTANSDTRTLEDVLPRLKAV